MSAAARRYADIQRSVLESTTTGAAVLHTAPDRMRVDRWGNTLSVNDPRDPNAQTRTTYNANNQVLETTLPAVTRPAGTDDGLLRMVNTYDHAGRLLSAAKIAGDGKLVYTTRYQYDDKGALKREDHADGGYTTYTSDAFGQRLSSTQYLNASQSVTYSYAYDRLGNLATRTSAPVTVYDWDGSANGKTATFQNARRIVDAYAYDELGRRISTTNYSTDTSGAQYGLTVISALRYDVGGNVILSTDGNGLRTLRVYDALGNKHIEREASAYDPGTSQAKLQHWNYDGFGRLQSYIDLAGNVTDNVYNAAGQLAVSVQMDANRNQMRRTSYEYEGGTGYLVKVLDTNFVNGQNLQQLARYSYDRAGNRITEQAWLMGSDGQLQRALQDQVLAYDRRNQLTRITSSVPGADYRIAYAYDAFGNREQVTTEYTNDIGHKKTITVNYKFDAMDRVREVSGKVDTLYDKPVYVPPSRTPIRNEHRDEYYEDFPRDIGYYKDADNALIEKHVIAYNWAGNRASDNNETYQYDALGRLSEIRLGRSVTGYRRYDSLGRVIEARNGAEVQLNDYDAGGRLTFQRTQNQTNGDQRSRVTYYYDGNLGLLDSTTAQGASGGKLQRTMNVWNELRGTRLLGTTTVRNDGGSDYKTSKMEYDIGGVMSRVTAQVYANNKLSDDTASARTMISDYNGQLLEKAQNGMRTHVLLANDQMIGENSASHETFSTVHEGLSTSTDANVSVYVVQSAGEKLTSIAKAIWGDERLWYLIADANGLTFAATLTVGQPLTIPANAGASYNGADTFKPYNAAEIIGSTTPEMALPLPQQSGGGCGGLGQLVMIVVAVVATIYTAGLAAGALGVSAAGTSAWAAGAAAMTGGYGFGAGVVAAGAIGGATGSIASQAVGIAIGAQDGFNWKGVALSAIGGGVSAGVAGAASQGAFSNALMGPKWGAMAARAALGNVVSQGISVATGLQNSFSWRGVAASAAGAAVGTQADSYLGGDNALGNLFKGNEISRATAIGFAAGATTAIAHGGKIDVVRIATDAFGNALGESLVESMNGSARRDQLAEDQMRSVREEAHIQKDSWAARSDADSDPGGNVMTADEVKRRVMLDILSEQARDDSLITPDMLQTGGPARGAARYRPGNFEMVKNNNWDNAMNMAADPFGLLGEVPGIMDDLGRMSETQAKNQVDAMRVSMIKAGVKNVPTDHEYYISNSGSGIDFKGTVERLGNVYEGHIRDQRLRETWGDDYESIRVGKSKMTVLEFEKKVLDVHLQMTDVAYEQGVDLIAKGKLAFKDGQYARTLGSFIDEQVRDQLRSFAKVENINDGPMSNIWAINRRIKSDTVAGYGIPDGRIGFNIFHDTTLARKDGYTPQLSKWNAIRPGNFLIIRPTELGGPYVVPRQSIQPYMPMRNLPGRKF